MKKKIIFKFSNFQKKKNIYIYIYIYISLLKIIILNEIFLANLLQNLQKNTFFCYNLWQVILLWIIISYKIVKFVNISYKIYCEFHNQICKYFWKKKSKQNWHEKWVFLVVVVYIYIYICNYFFLIILLS